MHRHLNIIADDYGLSPGISGAIRELIVRGKITGTGCMSLFPEWPAEAKSLRQLKAATDADVGLHLTLTDFAALSAKARLPSLGRLTASSLTGLLDGDGVAAELDAQLERFIDHMGRLPDFLDGHQHIHFLPQVRRWLESRWHRLEHNGRLPWLRGAPAMRRSVDANITAKTAFVGLIAAGFDSRMKAAGFPVRGPLLGFYDWKKPDRFMEVVGRIGGGLPTGSVVMCHPGWIDDTLAGRDCLVDARRVEFEMLAAH
jgi:chitin disaccharide deacetylase